MGFTLWLCQKSELEAMAIEIVDLPVYKVIFHGCAELHEGIPSIITCWMGYDQDPSVKINQWESPVVGWAGAVTGLPSGYDQAPL